MGCQKTTVFSSRYKKDSFKEGKKERKATEQETRVKIEIIRQQQQST